MELFSRLGALKEQLASASEAAESASTRETNSDGTTTEAAGQEVSVQATTALVCAAEDTELDIQLQQLFQAVQVRPLDSSTVGSGLKSQKDCHRSESISLRRWQSKAR